MRLVRRISTPGPGPPASRRRRAARRQRSSAGPIAGGPATRHLVNERVLRALGPKGTLINIARGSIVDEAALARALADGTIKAAGLDVFENEPQIPDALLAQDNAVLLPHVGSATRETRQAMGDLCKANLDAWFAERKVLTLIPELRPQK